MAENKNQPGGSYNGTHWSQSPEGRKKMSEIQKKRFAKARKTKPTRSRRETHNANGTAPPQIDEAIFAYALGHVECWLGNYAESAGVPTNSLTSRVGKVLHSKARG